VYEYIGIFKVHITILYALTRAERERCVAVEDADTRAPRARCARAARARGPGRETEITEIRNSSPEKKVMSNGLSN